MRPPLTEPLPDFDFDLALLPVWYFSPTTQFVGHDIWNGGCPRRIDRCLVLSDRQIELSDEEWTLWEELERRGLKSIILCARGGRFETDYYARSCIGIPGPSGLHGTDFHTTPGDPTRPPQALVKGIGLYVVAASPEIAVLAADAGTSTELGGRGTIAMRDSDGDEFELPIGYRFSAFTFVEMPTKQSSTT